MKKKLTAIVLGALRPNVSAYYVADTEQKGLRVRVAPSGTRTWNVAYRIKGVKGVKSTSLGPCDPDGKKGLGLADARERAAAIMKAARLGRSLIEEEEEARRTKSERLKVTELIDRYAKHIKNPKRKGGPLRSAVDIERRLMRALEAKLDTAADSLRRIDISSLLDPVWEEYPREAEKRRQVIGAMYRWGIAKGYVTADPTHGTESYGDGEPGQRRLEPGETKAFWEWLDEGAESMPPDCIAVLRLQLCLGNRASEIGGMDTSELCWMGDTLFWRLPAARAKNKKEHFKPLVGLAREIVDEALKRRKHGPLFRTANSDRPITATDIGGALGNRTLPCAHFTSHDLRRTVVSGMDELGISLDTIAAVISHQRGTKNTRTLIKHYSRANLDMRVETALSTWDARLRDIIAGRAEQLGDNVVKLRA
ncbi:Phage integrase family protein [Mesorhizobium albiziae]|uniref:Phage integrase family protein n=1 Tax=Neomesorhizobium albiziae TaxID=335020 RepID=A0A1I4CIQ8_9HYPH|nr:integrase family protein [Mesorhizobium albiziae]GLS29290.1 integrase [Mesorhizobium albiziae]SFK81124.1 Phage integrase family protein [Mesorhizobium albiziae]